MLDLGQVLEEDRRTQGLVVCVLNQGECEADGLADRITQFQFGPVGQARHAERIVECPAELWVNCQRLEERCTHGDVREVQHLARDPVDHTDAAPDIDGHDAATHPLHQSSEEDELLRIDGGFGEPQVLAVGGRVDALLAALPGNQGVRSLQAVVALEYLGRDTRKT